MKLTKKEKIITRFAPSPTGLFHIGSARTALFNYLFAKNPPGGGNGKFILRIEDTDIERSKLEFEKDIIESLEWLGIKWDKGPVRQSERKKVYRKYLEKLLQEKKAFYCFCASDELEAKRQEQMSRGLAPKYDGKCADLSDLEIKENLRNNKKYVIRFRTPIEKIKFNDFVKGEIEFDGGLIGDFVIAKDLDTPLYNFTVVVDDFEMAVSHIIRGEDILPNTPKQIFIEQALGFNTPKFGHIPLILGPDKSKLSKRHGATSLNEYKAQGYLPETIINFLAFLGWNPGTEKEIFSLKDLVKEFSVDRIQTSAAIFNIERLDYLNGYYIRHMPIKKLAELCVPYLIEANLIMPVIGAQEIMPNFTGYFGKEIIQKIVNAQTKKEIDMKYLEKAISLYQERLKKLSEIGELVDFFFKDNLEYEKSLLVWKNSSNDEIKAVIDKLVNILSDMKDWKKEKLEKILLGEAEKIAGEFNKGKDKGFMLWPMRVALTGKKSSAGPFEVAEVLGKEKTIKRLESAKENI